MRCFRPNACPGRWCLVAVGIWLSLAGCVKKPPPPPTYPVTGKVFLSEGRPLPRGAIYFCSASDSRVEALADIQPDGSFSLYMMHQGRKCEGTVPGCYAVNVVSDFGNMPRSETVHLSKVFTVEPKPNAFEIRLFTPPTPAK